MNKLWNSPVVSFLREGILLYFSRRVPQAAACLAYFLLLSIFPVLICVTSVVGLVNVDISTIVGELRAVLPNAALEILARYLRDISLRQSPALFLAGFAAGWFSSAAAFRTITRVILDMYTDVSQSFFRHMLTSILFPFALLVTMGLSVVVIVTGQRSLWELSGRFPILGHTLGLWVWGRYVLLFVVFFFFILAVLNMAAPIGTPRLPVMVSSLVSSLALVVSSGVFSWFIDLSSKYSLVYGSLVSLIVLLVWLYLCGQILFLGIVFTSVWYRHWRRTPHFEPPN